MEQNTENTQPEKSPYGQAILVENNPYKQEKRDILNYIRASFKDHRLINIAEIEGGTFILSVENPKSTGRSDGANMHLSQESMIGLMASMAFYWNCKGRDLGLLLKEAVEGHDIRYEFSDNLREFDKEAPMTMNTPENIFFELSVAVGNYKIGDKVSAAEISEFLNIPQCLDCGWLKYTDK